MTNAGVQASDPVDAQLGWDELGLVAEGLALGMRPLRAAAREITQEYDLGPRGTWILSLVSSGVVYPLGLSEALKTGRSLVTAELARLVKAGLLTATADSKDRRRSQLALTAAGQAACQQVRSNMERILRRNLAGYSPREIRLMISMLRDVRRLEGDESEVAGGLHR